MNKKKVTVLVAGQKFSLVTTESEKYVIDTAAKIDAKINALVISSDMTREKAAVLTALDLSDDNSKLTSNLSDIKEQIKDYIVEINKLKKENKELKEKLAVLSDQSVDMSKNSAQKLKDNSFVKENEETDDDLFFGESSASSVETKTEVKSDKNSASVSAPDKTVEKNNIASLKNQPQSNQQMQQKASKKRHEHNHTNPYKEQFMNKKEDKGYQPQRQYSLFDDQE